MGLQKYGPETLLLTNQWVNSYKRLRSGFRAPLYFASSIESNETNIQTKVCGSREANAPKTGFCISHADAACNPYLALIGLIASGMAGVSHKGFKLWQNHKVLNPAEVNKELQPRMADNLQDAINAFKTSDLLSVVLGSEIYDHLLKIKKDEADRFKKYVTKWEQEHQLRVL